MINLLNKILAVFKVKLVSTKPVDLVQETVKFMKENPEYLSTAEFYPPYVGDINYVKERVEGEFPQVSGTTYFQSQVPTENKPYFNSDGEKLSEYQLKKRLKND